MLVSISVEVSRGELTLCRLTLLVVVAGSSVLTHIRVGRAKEYRVIGVSLDVLLEILRSFESLATEVALMRLQRDVDSDMRGDVITLDGGNAA